MDDDAPDHDSGPFCRHWGDPYDCERLCTCGHACRRHCRDGNACHGDADEDADCACAAFTDDPDGPPPFASKPKRIA